MGEALSRLWVSGVEVGLKKINTNTRDILLEPLQKLGRF
jgi:hypothetical protein